MSSVRRQGSVTPFSVTLQRVNIDAHKAGRLADPYRSYAYETIRQDDCLKYWIEQMGDAELYEQRWNELND